MTNKSNIISTNLDKLDLREKQFCAYLPLLTIKDTPQLDVDYAYTTYSELAFMTMH